MKSTERYVNSVLFTNIVHDDYLTQLDPLSTVSSDVGVF